MAQKKKPKVKAAKKKTAKKTAKKKPKIIKSKAVCEFC